MTTYTLLPNGKQQFIDANGAPLAGGSVYFYVPGTTTLKDTYQDASGVTLNTNPVVLDASGQAVIYGTGQYRQIVYDVDGNLIWDQLTQDIMALTVDFATIAYVQSLLSSLGTILPGCIFMWGSATVPSGYLECNGAAVSRSTYAALFTAIGTTHGAGDGSTTFNLPDGRGYVIRGYDNGRGVDTGRVFGSTQADALLIHTHTATVTDPGHTHQLHYALDDTGFGGLVGSDNASELSTTKYTYSNTTGITVANANSTGASEVRVKNLALMFIIKT